jgi:diguanylate cyclase (GGDEF)-like protein
MTLHMPTMLVVVVLSQALITLELFLLQRRLSALDALRRWTWGSALMLLAYTLLAARVVIPEVLSVALGNGLLMLGVMMYADAVQRFIRNTGLPPLLWRLSAPLLFGFFLLAQLSTPVRVFAMSLLSAMPLAWIQWLIWRGRHGLERSMAVVALMLGLVIVTLLVRAIHVLMAPGDYHNLFAVTWIQGLVFLSSALAILGAAFGFVMACSERANKRLEALSSRDHLTGGLNRKAAEVALADALGVAQREGGPVAFVLMDLDHFKQVNDAYGHFTGDEVLRQFVRTARESLRSSDVVARFGGEEFALVLRGTDAAGARVAVEELRESIAALALKDQQGKTFHVTVSAGVAVALPGAGQDEPQMLYRRADAALYLAKQRGRNRVEFG